MIRAQSADGKIHEFPDGTSEEVIDRVMRDYAQGRKKPSMARDFMRPIKAAADRLVTDVKADYARAGRQARGEEGPKASDILDNPGSRTVGNLFGLAGATVQGATDAVLARPVARAAVGAGLPVYERTNLFELPKALPRRIYGEDAEAAVAGDINTALMGARAPGGKLTQMKPMPPAPKPAPRPPPKPTVKAADLKIAKQKAYEAAENAGVSYSPAATDSLVQGIADDMAAARLRPRRHPNAASVLDDDILPLRGSQPTLQDLDDLRQIIREDVIQSGSRAEQRLGQRMIKNIDEFIAASGPEQVVAGDAVKGAQAIKDARSLNQRFRKVESVEEALESARRRAGSTGSGGNVDNATRQNLRRLLENGNWTPDEAKALDEIVVGGQAQNFLRLIGKLSPGGNGLMTALNIGGAAANPLLAVPGVTGIVAKMQADAMTARKVQQFMELIASGGEMAAKVPRVPLRAPNLAPVAAGNTAGNAVANVFSEPR